MTAAGQPEAADDGSPGSVRHAPVAVAPLAALAILLIAAEIVFGIRIVGNPWQGGDLLYHSALANAVARGQLPPGGPYAGMPAYYPPGFHVMLAAVMGLLGLDAAQADQLLTLAWLPILPFGTFLLTRRLTGRPWVAVLAATLTVFGGAYDLRAGRLWVNSLFPAGHEAYPLYPRDVVFALLPFGLLAYFEALMTDVRGQAIRWTAVAGAIFGIAALVQVQLLLPVPVAVVAVALAVAVRRPERRGRALAVSAGIGVVALAIFAPWLLGQLDAIRRNGGVSLASDSVVAARFGPWAYPLEFGLLLPLGLAGAGSVLLFLRRRDGPRPVGRTIGSWWPASPEEPLAIVVWFGFAFALGVLYDPGWPLQDALQPQRLWLLAGQPLAVLAAIGLVVLAEDVAARVRSLRVRQTRLVAVSVAAVAIAICAPTTFATVRLVQTTWTQPSYAALDLAADKVPAFNRILPTRGPRTTVLTYEDWSALAWYETGAQVVGLVPAGFAKLGYDPAVFTGRGQAIRRAALLDAFAGDPENLSAVAASYDAAWVVIARRGDALGWIDATATQAALQPDALTGGSTTVDGNGWDALAFDAGTSLDLRVFATGSTQLEIRISTADVKPGGGTLHLGLSVVGVDDVERQAVTVALPPASDAAGPWRMARADVNLQPGDRIRLRAIDRLAIQSVRGFVVSSPVVVGAHLLLGWQVSDSTANAVVLEPAR